MSRKASSPTVRPGWSAIARMPVSTPGVKETRSSESWRIVRAMMTPAIGAHHTIQHDGFAGSVIGHYVTREGRRGVVLQQDGTRVVHVYGEKWLSAPPAPQQQGGEP